MPYGTYRAGHHIYDECPSCGGRKVKSSRTCRACREARKDLRGGCEKCGADISARARLCRSCFNQGLVDKRPVCVDCGKPTKSYASDHHAQRCWPCEVKQRRSQPARFCAIEGCGRVHQAKGLCRNHYRSTYVNHRRTRAGGQLIQWLKAMPCQICGYDRMTSTAARVIAGGPYRPGNVMALCVRCHREVDAGITPMVAPPTAEDILAFHESRVT